MIAQGSSELNISFVVKEKDGAALCGLYTKNSTLTKLNPTFYLAIVLRASVLKINLESQTVEKLQKITGVTCYDFLGSLLT